MIEETWHWQSMATVSIVLAEIRRRCTGDVTHTRRLSKFAINISILAGSAFHWRTYVNFVYSFFSCRARVMSPNTRDAKDLTLGNLEFTEKRHNHEPTLPLLTTIIKSEPIFVWIYIQYRVLFNKSHVTIDWDGTSSGDKYVLFIVPGRVLTPKEVIASEHGEVVFPSLLESTHGSEH